MGEDRKEIEVTPEMIEAAMEKLQEYDRAWEYIDRDMMAGILRAALSRVQRAS